MRNSSNSQKKSNNDVKVNYLLKYHAKSPESLARVKFTPAKKKKFLKLLIEEFNLTKAAHAVGMSRSAITYAIENDPEFAAAINEIKEYYLDKAENTILQLAGDKENPRHAITPAIFALKTHRKEWREKTEAEVNVNVTVNYTDDIRRALKEAAIDVEFEEVNPVELTEGENVHPRKSNENK